MKRLGTGVREGPRPAGIQVSERGATGRSRKYTPGKAGVFLEGRRWRESPHNLTGRDGRWRPRRGPAASAGGATGAALRHPAASPCVAEVMRWQRHFVGAAVLLTIAAIGTVWYACRTDSGSTGNCSLGWVSRVHVRGLPRPLLVAAPAAATRVHAPARPADRADHGDARGGRDRGVLGRARGAARASKATRPEILHRLRLSASGTGRGGGVPGVWEGGVSVVKRGNAARIESTSPRTTRSARLRRGVRERSVASAHRRRPRQSPRRGLQVA